MDKLCLTSVSLWYPNFTQKMRNKKSIQWNPGSQVYLSQRKKNWSKMIFEQKQIRKMQQSQKKNSENTFFGKNFLKKILEKNVENIFFNFK